MPDLKNIRSQPDQADTANPIICPMLSIIADSNVTSRPSGLSSTGHSGCSTNEQVLNGSTFSIGAPCTSDEMSLGRESS